MSGKHTRGPWELDGIAVAGSDPRVGDVCLMGEPAQYAGDTARMCDNWEANARLIAAAPSMLEALETVVNDYTAAPWVLDKCRAAIAKATGAA